jgi:hypothetical protein
MDTNIPDKYTTYIFRVKMEGPTYSSETSTIHGVIEQKTTTSVKIPKKQRSKYRLLGYNTVQSGMYHCRMKGSHSGGSE